MTGVLPAVGRFGNTPGTGRELSPRALCAIMNLPTLVTLTLVIAYPMVYAAFLSFHKVTPAELRARFGLPAATWPS